MPEDIEYGWSCIKFSKKERKEYQLLITPNIKIFVTQRKKRQVASAFDAINLVTQQSSAEKKEKLIIYPFSNKIQTPRLHLFAKRAPSLRKRVLLIYYPSRIKFLHIRRAGSHTRERGVRNSIVH